MHHRIKEEKRNRRCTRSSKRSGDAMKARSPAPSVVDETLCTGVDVGGTKVAILDTSSPTVHRYRSLDYSSMEAILDDYFATLGRRPKSIALAMAGPRDDETGAISLTNSSWPEFRPWIAAQRYPGTLFETANDMIGTGAGVLSEHGTEWEELKPGTPVLDGTKLIIAVSTGIGAAAAVWDHHTKRYVLMASEGGHIGIQPENEDEAAYLRFLQTKHPHVSAELALSGKVGVEHLVDHSLARYPDDDLQAAVERARSEGRPLGAVLLEFATEGTGCSREVARTILQQLGNMLGSALRDLAVAFRPSGGVYLTGSVALALGEYLTQETGFLHRFVQRGAVHDTWIDKIPVYMVTDSHVAVKGALELAKQQLRTI